MTSFTDTGLSARTTYYYRVQAYNAGGASGYKVERSANGWDGWAVVGTTGAGVTAYSDTGLAAGTTYYYRVRGIAPGVDGDVSATVSATTPIPSPPARPATLSATTLSSSQVKLTWSNVSGETGYSVWRSRDGKTWTQIAATAADVTTFTDTGLSARTTYYYRVQAYNSAGASSYSPVAKATTSKGGRQ